MKSVLKNVRSALGVRVSVGAKKRPVVDTDGRFKTKNKKHEAKITKKWNIEDFHIEMLYVHISWHPLPIGQSRELQLCRQQLEQWLNDTGRLDWCMEGYDGEGDMEVFAGSMAIDDYWENAEYDVKLKDLKDYIKTHQLIH